MQLYKGSTAQTGTDIGFDAATFTGPMVLGRTSIIQCTSGDIITLEFASASTGNINLYAGSEGTTVASLYIQLLG
jgi:hypothetical protein